MENALRIVGDALETNSLILLTLSDRISENAPQKIQVRPILLRGKSDLTYQFEQYQGGKVTHKNLAPDFALEEFAVCFTLFRQAQVYTKDADYQIALGTNTARIKQRPPSKTALPLTHNRSKNYLLPDNERVEFLVRLGVMGANGQVIAAKYDKFRQINRFLEMVNDVADHLPTEGILRVVDFGCGKSYLTFALYHYLHFLKGHDVQIIGLDLKRDVVEYCQRVAHDLHWEGLSFAVGDIQNYGRTAESNTRENILPSVDMVVTLHACDTATDDALARAVDWNARVILSVPCCQHELFDKIRSRPMQPLLKHGILKERVSALVTDALRAALLEVAGYSVQVVEFIDMEHTPKNLLLRAVRSERPRAKELSWREYETLRDEWGITNFHLENLLHPQNGIEMFESSSPNCEV